MAHQTVYRDNLAPALEGQVANMTPSNIVSRSVETGALAFGAVAVQGVQDLAVRPAATGQTKFVGIAVLDQAVEPASPNTHPVGGVAGILRTGSIWVKVGEAVAPGDPAFFVAASGAIMKTASGNIAIPNSRFDTTAAASGLALLTIL